MKLIQNTYYGIKMHSSLIVTDFVKNTINKMVVKYCGNYIQNVDDIYVFEYYIPEYVTPSLHKFLICTSYCIMYDDDQTIIKNTWKCTLYLYKHQFTVKNNLTPILFKAINRFKHNLDKKKILILKYSYDNNIPNDIVQTIFKIWINKPNFSSHSLEYLNPNQQSDQTMVQHHQTLRPF
jgi:hypothetical protein